MGLNRHPERVRAPWFSSDRFFDARDLVQVKYEMLRQVRVDGVEKTQAASLFGVSRPTFYQAEADFARDGLAGLLPKPRGPKTAHKLTPQVMAFIEARMDGRTRHPARAPWRARSGTELGLAVHPRSIERALARKKKRSDHPGVALTHASATVAIYEALRSRGATWARPTRRPRCDYLSRSYYDGVASLSYRQIDTGSR